MKHTTIASPLNTQPGMSPVVIYDSFAECSPRCDHLILDGRAITAKLEGTSGSDYCILLETSVPIPPVYAMLPSSDPHYFTSNMPTI